MSDRPRHTVNLDVTAGQDRSTYKPQRDDPFTIVVAGNFRGSREGDAVGRLHSRKLVAVDRDDVDAVLARFAPKLTLVVGEQSRVELNFEELEHFHPDELFDRAQFFRALRDARSRLADADTFRGTLASILGAGADASGTVPEGAEAIDVVADTIAPAGSLLDQIVDQSGRGDSMQSYLRGIVAPHAVPGEDPQREKMLGDIDASAAAAMRSVLHHPRFQALESLWRSVDFLVRRVETSPQLRVRLLDVDTAELRSETAAAELAHVLSSGCSLLVVDHAFERSGPDFDLLLTLAAVASHQGCAAVAGASAEWLGCDSFAERPEVNELTTWEDPSWLAFRSTAEAASIGLVAPRFLLRVPYGEEGEPCDRIDLEEVGSPPQHQQFLWANGAIAAATLIGNAFAASGWDMRVGSYAELEGLPMFAWNEGGSAELKPVAECPMTDTLAEFILDAGPMPLATIRHGDTARVVRFQSLTSPAAPLRGPWS